MRILFTFLGGRGHLIPLLPIADAAAAAGHAVAVAGGDRMLDAVRATGLPALRLEVPTGAGSADPPQRLPLPAPDVERDQREFRERFVIDGTRARVRPTEELCRRWRPDLLVVDEANFAGMLAAERLGLPHVTVQVLCPGSFVVPEVIGDALDQVRGEYGLPPDPGLDTVSRHLLLSPFPPGYRAPAHPLPATGRCYRAGVPAPRGDDPPPWTRARPGAPVIYFTLGTVFNTESGDLFGRVLAGLHELPVNALVTVGPDLDPGELGPQPDNVSVERFVPQDAVLPWCDLVLSHGGSGSVLGTLTHGLPSVLIPMGADQSYNAGRCAALGFGAVLDPVSLTPASVRDAVSTVLADPGHRAAARRLADEIAAQPQPTELVPLLERLGG